MNIKRIQDLKNQQQAQNLQSLQNINNINNLNKFNNIPNNTNINNLLLSQAPNDPNPLLYEQINPGINQPNFNNSNNSLNNLSKNNSSNLSNYHSSNPSKSNSNSKANSKSGEDSIPEENIKNLNPEDYIYEKFGKRGWQCEKCKNFNFETRTKCNRCGVPMQPKLINRKYKKKTGADGKTKKELVERTGDWRCPKCKNLNFAFRLKCNRCQLPKQNAINYLPNINNINNNSESNFNPNQINDQNLVNKLKLIYNNKLLQNIQQNKIPMQQGQNQISNINNNINNNNDNNNKNNKYYSLCCLVKPSHHIKGVCYMTNHHMNFKVFMNQETGNAMSGVNLGFTNEDEDYDINRKTCYGSFFMFHSKDKDIYKISINFEEIKFILLRKYYYKRQKRNTRNKNRRKAKRRRTNKRR